MSEVSIFQGFNKVVANKDIQSIVELIKGDKFKDQIDQLRLILDQKDDILYSKQKKKLSAFTPSGKFDGGRKPEFLEEYSGLIVLDIDKSNEVTKKLKGIINSCPYTYSCFLSPSGSGLKVLVKVNTGVDRHKLSFNKVKDYYESLIGFNIDPSGKDFTRLCFFSHDPDIYFKEDSWQFNLNSIQEKTEDRELIFKFQVDLTNSKNNYVSGNRNNFIYLLACNCNRAGLEKEFIKDIICENYDLDKNEILTSIESAYSNNTDEFGHKSKPSQGKKKTSSGKKENTTTNKFTITERYLKEKYIIRYNVVSCRFEYREIGKGRFKELNENNLFIKLQKDNINISLGHLVALLKSDFVTEYNPFTDYFKNLPKWDGETDYLQKLCSFLQTPDRERLERHFKKWIVRLVKTAIDDNYHNKQAFVLVSNKQNSGKSTFCRFLCPKSLTDYITENIGTDKDSLVAITENLLINLDELSTADKNEINVFKSMFSKDKIKARLTYDKRASIHVRRASFIGSTDRWEFLTDENGSVRWLCFDITYIDWDYSKKINIDNVFSQAYHLLKKTSFDYELSFDEIEENDRANRKYQVSTPERELIQQYLIPAKKNEGEFFTATDILEYINQFTTIKLTPERIGKELKFLGFERTYQFQDGNTRYGYYVEEMTKKNKN